MASAGLGLFHTGVEQGWWQFESGCTTQLGTADSLDSLRDAINASPIVACDQAMLEVFGLSMASWNIFYGLGSALLLIYMRRKVRSEHTHSSRRYAPHTRIDAARRPCGRIRCARRIYAGQLAVLRGQPCADEIRHMAEQEEVHLEAFNRLLPERGVRPSMLQPFWHVAGYALGAATAMMGEKAAMACTVAVKK